MTDQNELMLRSKILGAMLRQARNERGKSLKETAALIGTTPGKLSSYEKGERTISLPELELFSYQLDFPLKSFLDPETELDYLKPEVDPNVMLPLRQRILGAQLKAHRLDANLSIRKLSKMIGLPASRISGYERGQRPVPLDHLHILAETFGHVIEDYLDQDGPIGDWENRQEAVETSSQLSPDLRDFLSKPVNEPYLQLAKELSELPAEKLRSIAEGLLEITL